MNQRQEYIDKQASAWGRDAGEVADNMTAREWGFETAAHTLFGVPKEQLPMLKQAYVAQLDRQAQRVQQLAPVAQAIIAARR